MSTAGLTALLAGSLAAGTAQAAATDTAPAGAETSSLACEDPFEASSVDLVVGQPLTRGLCEPDGRYGGGDKDFLGFAAQAGKSYRIALIERGPGWDGAQLHIEDFYAIGSQVTFEKPDAYSAVTKPMPAGVASALFSVEALSTSDYFRTLSGPEFVSMASCRSPVLAR